MPDQTLVCSDCGATFVFTEAEQTFFDERSLLPPKRCKACRTTRRRGRVSGFTTKIKSNAPPAFPAEEQRSGTITKPPARSARHAFEILCAECGVTAFVPFKPLEGRAVYCPACYEARKGSVRQATDGVEIDSDDEGIIE